MQFKNFDKRDYPIVSARDGYGEWAKSYESSVPDLLDIQVFENLKSIDWKTKSSCLDLACGTGRTGQWLKENGVQGIDGVDLTPEMIEQARQRNIYQELHISSVEKTEMPQDKYDLITMCLVDEHLQNLQPVYLEAKRLAQASAHFIVVGMHPFFFMDGMPTHFDGDDGKPKAIETYVHLMGDHFHAAKAAGWNLLEVFEGKVDEQWLKIKPKWEKHIDRPVNYGYIWQT